MSDLYQEPDCGAHVPHAGTCTLCGAEPRWVVSVEPCQHGKIDGHHTTFHPLKDRSLDGRWCDGAGLEDSE